MASVVTMKDFEQYDSRNFLAQTSLQQRVICVILALATYLFAVQILRFKRRQALQERYSCYATRRSMGNMTDHDAWAIQKTIMQTEFPFIVLKSLQFALFRVWMPAQMFHTKLTSEDIWHPNNINTSLEDISVLRPFDLFQTVCRHRHLDW